MKSGRADFVLLARGLLREPYWPRLAVRALGRKDAVAGPVHTAEQGEHFGSCLPIQRSTSCCPFGSRRLLTPNPQVDPSGEVK